MHALIAIYKVGRNWLKVILKNEPLGLKKVYMLELASKLTMVRTFSRGKILES